MANSSTPFGFLSYGHRDGSAPTMGLEEFVINSSDTSLYFTGDLVVRSSAGAKVIGISNGSTSDQIALGVFVGCKYYSAAAQRVVWSRYYPGSVGSNAANGVTIASVITDPEMQFIAASGSSAAAWVAANIGFNVAIATSNSSLGNTATGQSAMILSTALSTSSSHPWKIVDLYANRSVSGTPGTEADIYNRVIVAPNYWERHAGTTAVSS